MIPAAIITAVLLLILWIVNTWQEIKEDMENRDDDMDGIGFN